jgi:predicted phage terminase large subunit-like protein
MVGNLISKTSVLQEFSDTKDVFLSKIKAIDAQGNPVWKEKWTKKEADEMRIFMGYRNWEKEMMHNPVNEGTIFKREWIKFKRIPPLKRYEQLVVYIDPSFKGTTKNDYKAVRFWGRLGKEFHLIDCYVRQDSVRGMVRWCYNLWEQLPENVAPVWYMEANFMQDTLLDEFEREGIERGHFLPVTPDKRKKPDKIARIEAVSPLWERGLVFYNIDKANDPDMIAGIDQTLGLERGSTIHDDAPDADEGAIWKMQKATRQESFTPRLGSRHSINKHNSW